MRYITYVLGCIHHKFGEKAYTGAVRSSNQIGLDEKLGRSRSVPCNYDNTSPEVRPVHDDEGAGVSSQVVVIDAHEVSSQVVVIDAHETNAPFPVVTERTADDQLSGEDDNTTHGEESPLPTVQCRGNGTKKRRRQVPRRAAKST